MLYLDLKNYLINKFNSHADVLYVGFGGEDEILAAQENEITYPCAWIEEPDMSIKGDGDEFGYIYETPISIIISKDDRDQELSDIHRNDCQLILNDCILSIREDFDDMLNGDLQIQGAKFDNIFEATIDRCDGLRMILKLTIYSHQFCIRREKFE